MNCAIVGCENRGLHAKVVKVETLPHVKEPLKALITVCEKHLFEVNHKH